MSTKARRIIAALALSLAAAAGFAAGTAHVVSFDHYGGAYGVSVGTDTHYCSLDTAWPAFTCEAAS